MKKFPVIVLLLLATILSCTQPVPLSFTRDEYVDIRRSPTVSHIDDAHVDSAGVLFGGLSWQYALSMPDVAAFCETTTVNDGFSSLTIRTTTRHYLSRHSINGQLGMSLLNGFSTGIILDASLGSVEGVAESSPLSSSILEVGWFCRFSAKFNRFSLAFRPEVLLYSIHGNQTIIDTSSLFSNAQSQLYQHGVTVRTLVSTGYMITPYIRFIVGGQHKAQPFTINNGDVVFENAFAWYVGAWALLYKPMGLSLYIVGPIPTDHSEFSEPVHGGAEITFTIPPWYE